MLFWASRVCRWNTQTFFKYASSVVFLSWLDLFLHKPRARPGNGILGSVRIPRNLKLTLSVTTYTFRSYFRSKYHKPDVVACICNPAKRRLNDRTVRVRIRSGDLNGSVIQYKKEPKLNRIVDWDCLSIEQSFINPWGCLVEREILVGKIGALSMPDPRGVGLN